MTQRVICPPLKHTRARPPRRVRRRFGAGSGGIGPRHQEFVCTPPVVQVVVTRASGARENMAPMYSPIPKKLRSRRGLALLGTVGVAAASLTATLALPGTAHADPGGVPASTEGHGNVDGFALPPIKHVWTIILENKSFESTFTGLNQNSFLWKTLTSQGVLLRQYYGTGHFSLDNYVSMVSGQGPTPDTQADCPTYKDTAPNGFGPDGQLFATSGCVYPSQVQTLFNQLDQKGVSWKGYMQSMGNDPAREQTTCGAPLGSPAGAGVANPGAAEVQDQYVPKHNPFVWFHSIIDSPECAQRVVPLAGIPASASQPAVSGLAQDLQSEATTPAFSWITPDNCSDAHDATCKGLNVAGTHQGGLLAADAFLQQVIPEIMASPAFQDNGMIDITFDEGFPPYQAFGSIADLPATKGVEFANQTPSGNTAQSVIACCNELPGVNVAEPGAQAFGQDTTPGGGVTGSVLISRFITPGTQSDQPYNHYSWLRSMEDLFGIHNGGTDGEGHLGYAGAAGLRPFGPDVYNNPNGQALPAAASGSTGIFLARSGTIAEDAPATTRDSTPIPDSTQRPAGDPYPEPAFPSSLPGELP
jgi:hypothetical protein